MLKNAPNLAIRVVDTAENEPSKVRGMAHRFHCSDWRAHSPAVGSQLYQRRSSLSDAFFFEASGRAWRRAVAQTPDEAFQKGLIEDKHAKSERKFENHPSLHTHLTSENSQAGNQRVPPPGSSSCTRGNPQIANPPAYLCGPMRPNQE